MDRPRAGVLAVTCALAALVALPAPVGAWVRPKAGAACEVPKGWYTAIDRYEYELAREEYFIARRIQRHVPPPGSTIDMPMLLRSLPGNAAALAAGTAQSAVAVGQATANLALALAAEQPSCRPLIRLSGR